jgi:hypothetical protein
VLRVVGLVLVVAVLAVLVLVLGQQREATHTRARDRFEASPSCRLVPGAAIQS